MSYSRSSCRTCRFDIAVLPDAAMGNYGASSLAAVASKAVLMSNGNVEKRPDWVAAMRLAKIEPPNEIRNRNVKGKGQQASVSIPNLLYVCYRNNWWYGQTPAEGVIRISTPVEYDITDPLGGWSPRAEARSPIRENAGEPGN